MQLRQKVNLERIEKAIVNGGNWNTVAQKFNFSSGKELRDFMKKRFRSRKNGCNNSFVKIDKIAKKNEK